MKISIENFKSIEILQNFELRPFTVLSGVNSAGKSSFIQFLLLLKQTLKFNAPNFQLLLSDELYSTADFKSLVNRNQQENQISISFTIDKSELERIEKPVLVHYFKGYGDYQCLVNVVFDYNESDEIFVPYFSVDFEFNNNQENIWIKFENFEKNNITVDSNSPSFIKGIPNPKNINYRIEFKSIFPSMVDFQQKNDIRDFEEGLSNETEEFSEVVKLDDIENFLTSFFERMSYIGPSRIEPKEEYRISKKSNSVGKNGENVAQIFQDLKSTDIIYRRLILDAEGKAIYERTTGTLLHAVKHWMCDIFNVARDIEVEKVEDIYRIFLIDQEGFKTNIKHVGFGISQLLPIVVEGLIMKSNGVFVVEQPEVHLHPKVQSFLYDFLYSLTLDNRMVLVETHSSHFITRMRRRIAEDMDNNMDDRINLTFVENNVFRTLNLDDYGTILNYYPKDFIEFPNDEMKAIISAQMKKRIKNEEK